MDYVDVALRYQKYLVDTGVLNKALGESAMRFYSSAVGTPSMQMRMNIPTSAPTEEDIDEDEEPIDDEEEELDDDYDEDDDIVDEADEDMDESDPFYFSDGMHW